MTEPTVWYMLACGNCDMEPGDALPFASMSDRGWWAAEHRKAHPGVPQKWTVFKVTDGVVSDG